LLEATIAVFEVEAVHLGWVHRWYVTSDTRIISIFHLRQWDMLRLVGSQ